MTDELPYEFTEQFIEDLKFVLETCDHWEMKQYLTEQSMWDPRVPNAVHPAKTWAARFTEAGRPTLRDRIRHRFRDTWIGQYWIVIREIHGF